MPELIDAPHDRAYSRLACVYSLDGAAIPSPLGKDFDGVGAHLKLGRFHDHVIDEGNPAPVFRKILEFSDVTLATPRGEFASETSGSISAVFVPFSGMALLLMLDFLADLTATVSILQETCFRREQLTLDGKAIRDVVVDGLPHGIAQQVEPLKLGRDVHQLLMVGRELAAELAQPSEEVDKHYDPSQFMRLVYREDRDFRTERGRASMRYPAELNRPFSTLCAHGRGVTVLVGAAEHVESAVVVTAVELVASLNQMRRIKATATDALATAQDLDDPETDSGQARAALGKLTRKLGDLEVDLSFGVDAYLDALRFPEIVLQSYRESLSETLGIAAGASRTADMLGRLKTVLDARREELAAVEGRESTIRRRRISAAVGYVTVVAVPLSAILAFLGTNVREVKTDYSLFRLSHYWPYYAGILGISLIGAVVYLGVWLRSASKIPSIR